MNQKYDCEQEAIDADRFEKKWRWIEIHLQEEEEVGDMEGGMR